MAKLVIIVGTSRRGVVAVFGLATHDESAGRTATSLASYVFVRGWRHVGPGLTEQQSLKLWYLRLRCQTLAFGVKKTTIRRPSMHSSLISFAGASD